MNIVTLSEAKIQGLTKYYTGVPCKHGHDTYRYTSDRSCSLQVLRGKDNVKKANGYLPK
jgi:hypothetical protein